MDIRLVLVKGSPKGTALRLSPGQILVGRGEECHVRSSSALVSRQHCLFEVEGDALHLRDLGSTNGTLVNGTRLCGICSLHDGDLVEVGSIILQVQIDYLGDPIRESIADTSVNAKDTISD
ncbi:MAG: FHA domain-containing protein [Gemmataceae bacterium]